MIAAHRLLVALLIGTAVAAGIQIVRAVNSAAEADRAVGRLVSVRKQISTINELNSLTPEWAQRTRPVLAQGSLATAVSDCLSAAGLAPSSLAALSPAADTPITLGGPATGGTIGMSAVRRRAVLTLAPVTLPLVGRVLHAWREAHPDWTISSIDLTPEPTGRRELDPGSDLPLRTVIAVEALFVDSASSARSRARPGARN
jgi:hypothetical protein